MSARVRGLERHKIEGHRHGILSQHAVFAIAFTVDCEKLRDRCQRLKIWWLELFSDAPDRRCLSFSSPAHRYHDGSSRVVETLGDSSYGIYALVGTVIGYFALLDLGLGNAVVKYVAEYSGQKDFLHKVFEYLTVTTLDKSWTNNTRSFSYRPLRRFYIPCIKWLRNNEYAYRRNNL